MGLASFEYKIVTGASLAVNYTTPPLNVDQMTLGTIQAKWSGSPVGSIQVLVSNDNITYSTYTGSSTSVSGPGDFVWLFDVIQFPWFSVQYTWTSGTGSLNVTFYGKGPG